MLELVQLASACGGLDPLVSLVKNGLFPIIYIVIPIALLVFAVIDFGKAVIASDEKEVKAVMDVVAKGGTGNTGDWWSCWESV